MIKFAKSGFEQRWNAGDTTLLETAEQHGLTPSVGCRTGACGSCAVKLLSGSVTYRSKPTATTAKDEILNCSAVPKKESTGLDNNKQNSNQISTVEIDL